MGINWRLIWIKWCLTRLNVLSTAQHTHTPISIFKPKSENECILHKNGKFSNVQCRAELRSFGTLRQKKNPSLFNNILFWIFIFCGFLFAFLTPQWYELIVKLGIRKWLQKSSTCSPFTAQLRSIEDFNRILTNDEEQEPAPVRVNVQCYI